MYDSPEFSWQDAITLYKMKLISKRDTLKLLSKVLDVDLVGEVGQYDKMYGEK